MQAGDDCLYRIIKLAKFTFGSNDVGKDVDVMNEELILQINMTFLK